MGRTYPEEKVNFDGIIYPYGLRTVRGDMAGHTVIHKFGHNHDVGTSFVPVTAGGKWPTPQVGSETALRIKAGGHADDTAAGTGAQEVTIYGISPTGAEIEEAIATSGASASSATTLEFLRVTRAIVTKSGTYATATANSHAAAIVIENAAGGTDWMTIDFRDSVGNAQSQIGIFTVPLGKTAYVTQLQIDVDSTKTVDILGMSRSGILDTAAPYEPRRVLAEFIGVTGSLVDHFEYPFGPFPELTDFGFMAKSAGSASVSVDYIIVLIDNGD